MLWENIFGGSAPKPAPPKKANAPAPSSGAGGTLVSAETLAALAAGVEEQLHAIDGILRASGENTASFARSLEESSIDLSDPEHARAALERLVGLTRDMVEKTRDVEARLRERNDAMALLNEGLNHVKRTPGEDQPGGPGNRREFERELGSAAERARIYNTPLSVAFCDIDNFKVINDIHGPATGDRVLAFISNVLDEALNGRGKVSRGAGAEFVILFEGKTARQARDLTENARIALSERHIVDRQSGRPVGHVDMSAGIAAIGHDFSIGAMLSKADQALFKAKTTGRGTVKMAV